MDAKALNEEGQRHYNAGDFQQAIACFERVAQEGKGEEKERAMFKLPTLYYNIGDTAKQLQSAKELVALANSRYGLNSRESVRASQALVDAERSCSRLQAALKLGEELVERCLLVLGPDHEDYGSSVVTMAEVLRAEKVNTKRPLIVFLTAFSLETRGICGVISESVRDFKGDQECCLFSLLEQLGYQFEGFGNVGRVPCCKKAGTSGI